MNPNPVGGDFSSHDRLGVRDLTTRPDCYRDNDAAIVFAIPGKLEPLARPSPLRRANIPSEFLRFRLDLFETLLHDVAYANDSMKCSTLNDR